ncbi:MAG: transcriptional regulator [Tatlockia sp.]|jgi:DNA-binding winged helix-turn-helix (wHTH) protein|nr:transcriptional regulator [Tatlockia sp.]
MSELPKNNLIYEFGPFQVSAAERQLLKDGSAISLQPKVFDLLMFLIENGGQLVEKQRLMDFLWKDTFVQESSLSWNISQLRKALGDSKSEPRYIETVHTQGFRFIAEVNKKNLLLSEPEPLKAKIIEDSDLPVVLNAEYNQSEAGRESQVTNTENSSSGVIPAAEEKRVVGRKFFAGLLIILLFSAAAFVWWQWSAPETPSEEAQAEINSPVDDAEIRQVVQDSQIFEFLTLNVHPEKVDAQSLPDFWLLAENGGQEILKVRAGVKRMGDENKRYGDESRLERFDFTYVRIYAPRNRARAGTIERWYLPLYQNEKLVPDRNVYLGPYPVDYILQKFNGKWLIERTTTPRAEQK